MGLDSSELKSEVSFGHFSTGAKMSGHFRPIWTVQKCLNADLFRVWSVRMPAIVAGYQGLKNLFFVPTDELLRAKDDLLSEGGQSLL